MQLKIGLLAHTQGQLRSLRILVENSGHTAAKVLRLSELERQTDLATRGPVADAWIVALDGDPAEQHAPSEEQLAHWLEHDCHLDRRSAPVIFCDGQVPGAHDSRYAAWSRRLAEKLSHLAGSINLARSSGPLVQQVWVLAASTGGPAAVKDFLAALPSGLGIGFIYVQHINAGFNDTLAQVVSRSSEYSAGVVEHGSLLRPDHVAIISPDYATELLANGSFLVHGRPWSAHYRPSADYMIANVAHCYGKRSGVIVFTGMGDDGALSARIMRQKGGRVWAQTPASCTSDAMPCATLATEAVEFSGTPGELSRQLAQTLGGASTLPPVAREAAERTS